MKIVVLLMALILTSSVWARSGQRANERMPDGAYFRHETSDGVVHLNRTLTMDAIRSGYQLLDQYGRVLEDVEGVQLNDAEAKAQRMQQARPVKAGTCCACMPARKMRCGRAIARSRRWS